MDERGEPYIYKPGMFRVGDISYRPDFYLPNDRVFVEVVNTRQAIEQLRHKIDAVQKMYPFVTIRILHPDGSQYRLGFTKTTLTVEAQRFSPQYLKGIYWRKAGAESPLLDLCRRQNLNIEAFAKTCGLSNCTIYSAINGREPLGKKCRNKRRKAIILGLRQLGFDRIEEKDLWP